MARAKARVIMLMEVPLTSTDTKINALHFMPLSPDPQWPRYLTRPLQPSLPVETDTSQHTGYPFPQPHSCEKKLKKKRNRVCKQRCVCKVRGTETEAYVKLMPAPKDCPVSVVQGYWGNAVVCVASWNQRGQNLFIFRANHHLFPILLFFFVLSRVREKRQHFVSPSQVSFFAQEWRALQISVLMFCSWPLLPGLTANH